MGVEQAQYGQRVGFCSELERDLISLRAFVILEVLRCVPFVEPCKEQVVRKEAGGVACHERVSFAC